MSNEENTDDIIKKLSDGLEPVKRRCPYRSLVIWVVFSIVYIAGVIFYLGPKINLDTSLTNAAFLFEMGIIGALFLSSAVASSFLSFPDGLQRGWIKGVTMTLFGVFLLWITANSIEEGVDLSMLSMGSCSRGILVEGIPFGILVFMTMRGYSTQPYWLMTTNVLAATALGWIGLRLTCTMYESMVYGFLHYLLPFMVLGAAIGFFARKIFKW